MKLAAGPDLVLTEPLASLRAESRSENPRGRGRRATALEPYGRYSHLLVRTALVRPEPELPEAVLPVVNSYMSAEALLVPVAQGRPGIELVIVLCVSGRNVLQGLHVREGTLHGAVPRDVLQPAFAVGASAFIVGQTHPREDRPVAGPADFEVHERLTRACDSIHIPMFDHIIIGRHGETLSMRELLEARG